MNQISEKNISDEVSARNIRNCVQEKGRYEKSEKNKWEKKRWWAKE